MRRLRLPRSSAIFLTPRPRVVVAAAAVIVDQVLAPAAVDQVALVVAAEEAEEVSARDWQTALNPFFSTATIHQGDSRSFSPDLQ